MTMGMVPNIGQLKAQPMQHPVKNREEQIEAAMYIDPWIGWRCWSVKADSNNVWLDSITYAARWIPEQTFTAECLEISGVHKHDPEFGEHKAPNSDHGCGIYSVTTKDLGMGWLNQHWLAFYNDRKTFRCIGEVKLWGNVIRFTKGFLAEHAYPKSLYLPHVPPQDFPMDSRECVHELKRTYRGVKVALL